MKSNKGQALVEFVIILPVALILLFCVIDFGRVISLKSDLENVASDSVTFYQDGRTKEDIKRIINMPDVTIDVKEEGEYTTIKVSKKIKPITPGLSYMVKNVFDVNISRVIKNE